ncbi:tetratricopeptide repeat protein [Nannocystaceae bacterium ST9]
MRREAHRRSWFVHAWREQRGHFEGSADLQAKMPDDLDLDDQRWDRAVAQLDEAGDALGAGQLDLAGSLAREAADELHAILGDAHPDFANARLLLAEIAFETGQPRAAMTHADAARASFESHLPEAAEIVEPMRLSALQLLARIHVELGHHELAEATAREAITIGNALGDPIAQASAYTALGVILRFAGRYDEAAAAYDRSAKIQLARGRRLEAEHFHNLAGLALAHGDARVAEAHARQAIALREQEDFGLATDLCGLADALAEQARPAEAEPLYRRALAIFSNSERAEHPEVAYALHNLADCLVAQERHDEAEAAYRESLARKLAKLGPGTPDEAGTRSNLAALLAERGRLGEAIAESTIAITIVRRRLTPEHPTRRGCEAMAASLAERVRRTKVVDTRERLSTLRP